jgi:hypothetical protein
MTEIEVIAALGIFFGCLSRAILPFLRKKAEAVKAGQQVKWEGRYVWTIIFTLFVAMISTMLLLPTFNIPSEYIFPYAFTFGWAAQDIVNKVAK